MYTRYKATSRWARLVDENVQTCVYKESFRDVHILRWQKRWCSRILVEGIGFNGDERTLKPSSKIRETVPQFLGSELRTVFGAITLACDLNTSLHFIRHPSFRPFARHLTPSSFTTAGPALYRRSCLLESFRVSH